MVAQAPPTLLMHAWGAKSASGSTVAASGLSGWEVAGQAGAVIGAGVAVIGLWTAFTASRRAQRREYAKEIRDAYDRGAKSKEDDIREKDGDLKQARREADYWRNLVMERVIGAGHPVPLPPLPPLPLLPMGDTERNPEGSNES